MDLETESRPHENDDQVQTILKRITALEGRDTQLWSIAILVVLILAVAFAALAMPNWFWELGTLRFEGRLLPQLIFAFVALVILQNIYTLRQRQIIRNGRQALVRELLRADKAERLAMIDPLTGVFNRRYMARVIEAEKRRAERTHSSFSVLLVDLDDFKEINSSFGHIVGDRLLREMANLMTDVFRQSDTIVRFGGDEFLVILPDTNGEEAQCAQRRLVAEVERWNRDEPFEGRGIGLSCGTASSTESQDSEELLQLADRRMYAAKGRQREPA